MYIRLHLCLTHVLRTSQLGYRCFSGRCVALVTCVLLSVSSPLLLCCSYCHCYCSCCHGYCYVVAEKVEGWRVVDQDV